MFAKGNSLAQYRRSNPNVTVKTIRSGLILGQD
jgi:hypothetical protein